MNKTMHRIVVAFAGACLWTAPASFAPTAARTPVPEVCDQVDSGERIKCKFNNVIEQQRGVVGMVGEIGMLPPSEQQALVDEVERAGRAQGRAGNVEFKQLTLKPKVSCLIKELIGDGKGDDDGVCKANEDCEEVLGDQIGNDDGVCRPRNGANREVCVEICDEDAINSDPDNFDDDPTTSSRGADLEQTLDGLTARYEEIGVMMDAEIYARRSAPPAVDATDPCEAVIRSRPSSVLQAVLSGAAEGARVAADVAERLCDQTAFGLSGSSACVVVEGVAGAAKIISNAVDVEAADIDSTTIDLIWVCLQETNETASASAGAIGDLSGDLEDVNDAVAGVDGKVVELQQQLAEAQQALVRITELLLVPQGQRDGFPDGTNEEPEPAPLGSLLP